MTLPAWTDDGLLPEGAHRASLQEIYDRCVVDAPNRSRREHLFRALHLYDDVAREVLGPIALLVSGGFVTAQDHSIGLEVAAVIEDFGAQRPSDPELIARAEMLITQPSIIVGSGNYAALTNVRPFAGVLDGFVVATHHRAAYERRFARVTDVSGDTVENVTKGYVEVLQ